MNRPAAGSAPADWTPAALLRDRLTYGPTSEVVISRPAKLFMALQVLLAILMLTVLIARAVSA